MQWGRRGGSGGQEPRPAGQFSIRRLDEGAPQEPPAPAAVPGDLIVVRFTDPASALTFVAAIRQDGERRFPPVRRSPAGDHWVEVASPRMGEGELGFALGGVVHVPDGLTVVSPRGRRHRWQDVLGWPQVSWIELAASFAPHTDGGVLREAVVVTTGRIARWMIDRFYSDELEVMLSGSRLVPALSGGQTWDAALIRVVGRDRPLPRKLTAALGGLPDTVVCRTATGRLLVDHRLRLPVSDEDLEQWVPAEQRWLVAGGWGVWRFSAQSAERPPPIFLENAPPPPATPSPGRFPPELRVTVRTVRDDQPRAVDAVLLEDRELGPLRRYLAGHVIGERAYLVLGPGRHLLAEPGRSLEEVPFGTPLHRIGPGGLFLEAGLRLRPALPAAARTRLFQVTEESIVVVTAEESLRLATSGTVPAWALWLGETVAAEPSVQPLSEAARTILGRVDAAGARVSADDLSADLPVESDTGLRTEGFLLEQQGRLAEAARKYWEAGDAALAARLYEMAAEADR